MITFTVDIIIHKDPRGKVYYWEVWWSLASFSSFNIVSEVPRKLRWKMNVDIGIIVCICVNMISSIDSTLGK